MMGITLRSKDRQAARWLMLLGAALALGACSSMNPGNWFGGSDETAAEEQSGPQIAKGEGEASEIDTDVEDSGEYPNLGTVPDAPEAGLSPNQRLIIEEGLRADRENARYASGPPPKLLPQAGGQQMPATPATPVSSSDLPPQGTGSAGPVGARASQTAASGGAAQSASAGDPAVPSGEEVMLVSIRFPEGSTETPAQADQVLEQVALIQQQEDAFLRVVGHTSGRSADGTAKSALSQERAQVIASRLARFGAAPGKIIVEGMADSKPVAEGDGAADRQNDRVEIFMIR